MITIPGPRQAAKLAAEFHALDREISELRTRANGLAKQRDERECQLAAFVKEHGEGKTHACKLAAGNFRFHLSIVQKRCSPSYKSELLRHIDAAELQEIIDGQPTNDELQFAAFPK